MDLDVLQVYPSFKERQCLIKLILGNDAMAKITKPDKGSDRKQILTGFYTNITYQYNFKFHVIALVCGNVLNDMPTKLMVTKGESKMWGMLGGDKLGI